MLERIGTVQNPTNRRLETSRSYKERRRKRAALSVAGGQALVLYREMRADQIWPDEARIQRPKGSGHAVLSVAFHRTPCDRPRLCRADLVARRPFEISRETLTSTHVVDLPHTLEPTVLRERERERERERKSPSRACVSRREETLARASWASGETGHFPLRKKNVTSSLSQKRLVCFPPVLWCFFS